MSGIPISSWTFAVRVWLATILALFVSFWLQLEIPSTAAVTVAILAETTRGQALGKAGFRLLATIVGVIASLAITGLFSQATDLVLAASAVWLGLCVFAARLFDGYRAYAAALSGYTVGIITVVNIDTPQRVFATMTDRVAAITIGILCVTLINDLFGSPPVWRGLDRRMAQVWHDVRDYARDILGGGKDDSEKAGLLFAQIAGLRDDIDVVAHDMADGRQRAGGARSAMLALIVDVTPALGPAYTLLAFVIVITGGLGSMPGALVGGVLIGLTEAMAGLLFTPSAKSMFSFGLLVLVLLFRPQGILGKRLSL